MTPRDHQQAGVLDPAQPDPPAGTAPAAAGPAGSLGAVPAPAARVVEAAPPTPEVCWLATLLHQYWGDRLRLGTSSWYFPGWVDLVWAREYSEATVVRHGLAAYAQHPLMRTISLDRGFDRPVDTATYARLAAQVPADFRFMVKAAGAVTDAVLWDPDGGRDPQPNPMFLDPATALEACVRPAVAGLRERLGVVLFQLPPLPRHWLKAPLRCLARLEGLLEAVVPALPEGVLCAVEVRDPALLAPGLARVLATHGAQYALSLHDRMPSIQDQLPMLRAMWPGPLVCRWSLQRGLAHQQARDLFEPYDRLAAPDPVTRSTLAQVIAATARARQPAFVAINNKAEGSAPRSVIELARELVGPALVWPPLGPGW